MPGRSLRFDADTKLIPSFARASATPENTRLFIQDLASRLTNRVQISSDASLSMLARSSATFDSAVDYATVVKAYENDPVGTGNNGKYSPGRVTSIEKTAKIGSPDLESTSTSYVERSNLTIRMSNRPYDSPDERLQQEAGEIYKAAMALNFANYNLCRVHRTLRVTPAMAVLA